MMRSIKFARGTFADRTLLALALSGACLLAGCPQAPDPAAETGPEPEPLPALNPLWRSDERPVTTPEPDPMLDRIRELAARAHRPGMKDAPQVGLGDEAIDESVEPGVEIATPAGTGAVAAPKAFTMKLGPGDTLDLVVSGQPEFSGEITVREDGTIALPTTADLVRAAGKIAPELADAVADAIHPKYAHRRPNVSAVLKRSPRLVYYVFGEVRAPGRYELPSTGTTVLDAVIRASRPAGPSADGGRAIGFEPLRGARYRRVHVFSSRAGEKPVIVDIWAAMSGASPDTPRLEPGAIVVVPGASGPWSEGEIGKRLAAHPETKERFATGGTP